MVVELASLLPVIVLSNGTLFTGKRLQRLRAWAGLPIWVQVSLDHPDPVANDAMRGPENHARVIDAIPRLMERGIRVRIATTVETIPEGDLARLCRLHRRLGVPDDDHVVRPIVRRGRAMTEGLGIDPPPLALEPELTITADGAFWSPFGPTVTGGRLDTDLLVTRTTAPLRVAAHALVRLASGLPTREGGTRFR